MPSEIVALLVPEGSPGATLLIRRASGQFAFARIDVRVAAASRAATRWNALGVEVQHRSKPKSAT